MSFQNKTVFITGASRGIGKAIALKLGKEGANIVIAAKSIEENPKLGGTIFTAAAEVEAAGGKALAVQCDVRFTDQVQQAVDKAVETFGVGGTIEAGAIHGRHCQIGNRHPAQFSIVSGADPLTQWLVSRLEEAVDEEAGAGETLDHHEKS